MNATNEKIKDLIDQNHVLENYFQNTIISQLFVDQNLILRKFTPPAMKQFNLALTDVGRALKEIHDNFRYPSMIENIQSVIESKKILEKEIQTADLRWYQMNILPYIHFEDNTTNGVIITFVEITLRINDLKEQEKLVADHETLLDTISHDIKNPLTNLVLAIAQFKAMSIENPEGFEELLGVVERALNKMKYLIEELTESREKEHKYKPKDELLNVENILKDVRLTLTENIKSSGAIIQTDVQASEVIFSRRKLRSIIFNLLNNAIKYSSSVRTPEILIRTFKENDYTVISIKDNGIGIEKNKQDAVFSKYYRIENNIEGSGIGLYLVRELVINAGGKIKIKSEVDKGTEITVFLKQE